MNLENKTVLVVGTGISGIAAAELLLKIKAYPVLFDENIKADKKEIESKLSAGIPVLLGTVDAETANKAELLIISPGVPADCPLVKGFLEKGVPVWGEIELAYRFSKGRILAITGTNGKTTTTSLLGEIMKNYCAGQGCKDNVFIVGNIGNPYTMAAMETDEASVVAAEISSFQLETIHKFRPAVSAILNISPDHLNRHHTMEEYIRVKESITKNQEAGDTCVLNYEDTVLREFAGRVKADVFFFSSAQPLKKGIYLSGDTIFYADEDDKPSALMSIHEMNLLGIHNVENVMAAIAMAYSFGLPMESILGTVKTFKAVEHRIEYVSTKRGVDYYNDSKGTNPDAAVKGIQAMQKPTLLIGGGYDKQSEYDEWIESFEGRVKYLILIGQTAEKIAECARKHGFDRIIMEENLEGAVNAAVRESAPGDAVLLSPACASWGMFPNYEVRGKVFKELVNKIEE